MFAMITPLKLSSIERNNLSLSLVLGFQLNKNLARVLRGLVAYSQLPSTPRNSNHIRAYAGSFFLATSSERLPHVLQLISCSIPTLSISAHISRNPNSSVYHLAYGIEGKLFGKMSNLTTLSRSDTVTRAIAAGKQQAKTLAPREGSNNEDEATRNSKLDATTTSKPAAEPKIDTSIFDVFTDFELDLSCLSPPGSPSASTSELPPSTPSPGPSPPTSPILSRTISYASQLTLPSSSKKKTSKKASSPHLSSTVPAGSRGSWPVIKYAGRGTPIDRSRRLEWGGFGDGEVGEDGVLFSAVRSTSLDSAVRPSQSSLSPVEADWSHRASSSLPSSAHSQYARSLSHRTASTYEQAPELAPIQIEGLGPDKSEDWDSIMKTVLSPTEETPEPPEATPEPAGLPIASAHEADRTGDIPQAITQVEMMSPEQIEQLNSGLEMDLGLNAALDLGLGQRGGMNWFDLGLLPGSLRAASASGRESPSVYSSHEERSTHTGQRHADRDVDGESDSPPSASVHNPSVHRSNTSTKAGHVNGLAVNDTVKVEPPPQRQNQGQQHWWSRILVRLRRVHTIIAIHKSRL